MVSHCWLFAEASTASQTRWVSAAFDEIHRGGTAIVVVTHDERIAAKASRVLRLEQGRLCGADEPPRMT